MLWSIFLLESISRFHRTLWARCLSRGQQAFDCELPELADEEPILRDKLLWPALRQGAIKLQTMQTPLGRTCSDIMIMSTQTHQEKSQQTDKTYIANRQSIHPSVSTFEAVAYFAIFQIFFDVRYRSNAGISFRMHRNPRSGLSVLDSRVPNITGVLSSQCAVRRRLCAPLHGALMGRP